MGLVFWLSIAAVFFAYVGYPAALAAAGFVSGDDNFPEMGGVANWPSVSVILTVFNEEKIIAEKIGNFLACKYPGTSELVIVSDGSTDGTGEIIRRFEGERIRLIANRERRGKDPVLADAVRNSVGEIMVFTDVGAMFAENALAELIRPFANPDVGLVTGVARYTGARSAGLYRRYEDWIKSLEANLGVLSGALGPMYAIRRSAWRPKELALFNDFTDPILVALEGKNATLAARAVCRQNRSDDEHWARQVRNVACAAAVLFHFLPRLIAARRWKLIFVLISHKLLRWLTVPFMVLLVAAAWIERDSGGLYRATLGLTAAYLTAAAAGFFAARMGRSSTLRIAYDFLAMNVAALVGLVRYARGEVPTVWQPRGL